jgi:hypothetical protein
LERKQTYRRQPNILGARKLEGVELKPFSIIWFQSANNQEIFTTCV